jgi:hypothetical protein
MSIDNAILMWCEDGHTWINQGDGTVSPSWGLGGTHMPVHDPLLCPEPERDDEGRIAGASCAGTFFVGGSDEGAGGADAIGGHGVFPQPVCLKPAVGGNAWRDQYLPFDRSRWCAWWVRAGNADPWRLTLHQGHSSRLWAATYECLDVHTGERLEVDRTYEARRASLAEYPASLRERWWTTEKGGKLIGCWSTMRKDGAGWLIGRRLVETWVREAVADGTATAGQQLDLIVDA